MQVQVNLTVTKAHLHSVLLWHWQWTSTHNCRILWNAVIIDAPVSSCYNISKCLLSNQFGQLRAIKTFGFHVHWTFERVFFAAWTVVSFLVESRTGETRPSQREVRRLCWLSYSAAYILFHDYTAHMFRCTTASIHIQVTHTRPMLVFLKRYNNNLVCVCILCIYMYRCCTLPIMWLSDG